MLGLIKVLVLTMLALRAARGSGPAFGALDQACACWHCGRHDGEGLTAPRVARETRLALRAASGSGLAVNLCEETS